MGGGLHGERRFWEIPRPCGAPCRPVDLPHCVLELGRGHTLRGKELQSQMQSSHCNPPTTHLASEGRREEEAGDRAVPRADQGLLPAGVPRRIRHRLLEYPLQHHPRPLPLGRLVHRQEPLQATDQQQR